MPRNKKNIFLDILLGIFALLIYAGITPFASAQTKITISTSVPGTAAAATINGGPGAFVANFYQFALMIGGVLAFGVIVYGGVKYMASAGNPSGQSDAKEWIEAALLGLLLLVGAYFILSVVNPQLLNLNLPALSPVDISGITVPGIGGGGGGGNGGGGGSGGGVCTAPASGPCSVASLQNTCMGNNAAIAGGVCMTESSNNPANGGDLSNTIGSNGKPLPASVGLFQINLSANTIPYNCTPGSSGCLNCPAAFTNRYTGSNPHTAIKDMNLYQQCYNAAINPSTNIKQACTMSKNGTNWTQWGPSTRQKCGV